jgi:beta-1,2-xylosyltransferase
LILPLPLGYSYRYRLDVDGYGWSSRWQKLLTTDSVILKSTIYVSFTPPSSKKTRRVRHAHLSHLYPQPEWWTAQAIPWYHYIPLKYDYTDLWDILTYFDGALDGSSKGHEDQAEKIAQRGLKLAEQNLR